MLGTPKDSDQLSAISLGMKDLTAKTQRQQSAVSYQLSAKNNS